MWSYLSFMLGRGLNFVATVILARLLVPEQFGLMGFCLVGIQYLDILSRFGLDVALISRRDEIETASNTIFVMSLVTGTVFYIAAWFGAPFLAIFFNEPEIVSLFRVLSIVLLIDSFALVHEALLRKNLKFRRKLIPDTGKGLAKGGIAIALALSGYGVWALVFGQIAGSVASVILLWILIDWRPSWRFERQAAREIVGFGGNMIAVEFIGALRNNVDYLFIGRLLGATTLGLYTMAYRMPELLIKSLNNVVGSVTHPIMSRLQTDDQGMTAYYAAYLRFIASLTFPAGLGLAIVAPAFVHTLYTDTWEAAIFPMQCVSIALGISSVGYVPGVLYKAMNRPDILNKTAMFKLPVFLVTIGLAATVSLNTVALSQIGLAIFYMIVDSVVARRILGFTYQSLLRALMPALLASMIMGLVTWPLAELMPDENWIEIVAVTLFGIFSYLLALRFIAKEMVDQVIGLVRPT